MTEITHILQCEQYLDGIEAVIFDLDDTLYNEKDYVRSGYAAVAEAFPQIENMASKLWAAFEASLPAIDKVLEDEGIGEEYCKKKAVQIYREHIPSISLSRETAMLLDRLSREKKLGIITDGRPEGQWAKISSLGIESFFDKIIVTDELGGVEFRKPNDRAFVLMSEALGVSFERMIYIGDNLKKDFIAPERLGMRYIHFVNKEGLYNK